jgi:hypothetical protein
MFKIKASSTVCLSDYLSIYLSVCLSCLSVYLSIYKSFVGPWPLIQILNPIHIR